jgi:dTDP-4-amino-4,6-dideoxygalactose transaminase
VIEDCAQAHGARIDGKLAGTWGEFGAFSFYPTKNLGALGDAGCLVTNDSMFASEARSYINYGSKPSNKYEYQIDGVNSRLDPIQAAVLSVNLKYLDLWNARRIEIGKFYTENLRTIGIETLKVQANSVFHHFIVESENRDETRRQLDVMGVKTEIHYPECAEISFSKFEIDYVGGEMSNAANLARKTLSLPISPWMSDEKLNHVIDALSKNEVLSTFFR